MKSKLSKAERGANQSITRLKRFNIKDEIIMDIGANVGYVSRWLIDNGAKRVVSYEPHPLAFAELKERCQDGELINAALLNHAGKASLSTSKKDASEEYYCNATIVSSALPVHHYIDVLAFSSELDRVKPTAMKIDTEGSEYDMLLNNDLPDSVRWISMEVHKLNSIGAPLFAALIRKLGKQGFGLAPLMPSTRPAPGVLKTFWGFQQADFSRDYTTLDVDAEWADSMIMAANATRKVSKVESLQKLFDQEFPR